MTDLPLTPRQKALLFGAPPLAGLLGSLIWAVVDWVMPKGWPVRK